MASSTFGSTWAKRSITLRAPNSGAAEDHDRADRRAGQERRHRLGDVRHVGDHPVALAARRAPAGPAAIAAVCGAQLAPRPRAQLGAARRRGGWPPRRRPCRGRCARRRRSARPGTTRRPASSGRPSTAAGAALRSARRRTRRSRPRTRRGRPPTTATAPRSRRSSAPRVAPSHAHVARQRRRAAIRSSETAPRGACGCVAHRPRIVDCRPCTRETSQTLWRRSPARSWPLPAAAERARRAPGRRWSSSRR